MGVYLVSVGHGGKDSGAIGYGTKESIMTLKASLLLGGILHDGQGKNTVYLTRYHDTNSPPTTRKRIIQNTPHNLLVSIHFNAGGGTGFESFIQREPSQDEIALQSTIHDNLATFLWQNTLPDRGKKRKNWDDLIWTTAPSIFLELGFMDSEKDMRVLTNPLKLTEMMMRIGEVLRHAC